MTTDFKKYHDYLHTRSFLGGVYRKFFLYPLLSKHLKGKTLDVGCGLGDFCRFRPNTIGVDINSINVDYCRDRGVRAHLILDGKLPFADNTFDSVVLDNVLEHIEDPNQLINEIYRVLIPGGIFLVGVPGVKGYESDPDHVVYYDELELRSKIESLKFKADKYFYTPLFSRYFTNKVRQFCTYMTFMRPGDRLVTDINISVVIPMYNSEKTIISALDSVKIKKEFIKEIVIVNDGSTDRSHEIVVEYIKNNPEMNIILYSKPNEGVSKARNIGIQKSTGNYIAFLDSDDEWLLGKIEAQVNLLRSFPNVGLIGTARNQELYKKFLLWHFCDLVRIPMKMSLLKNFFPTPTVIINREVVSAVGYFDEKMSHLEDQDYWSRIARHFDCYVINQSLVLTGGGKPHLGSSGLSGNLLKMELGELRCISKALYRGFAPVHEAVILYLLSGLKFFRRLWYVYLLRK
jgi:glycosyltransferase involved in cell wall biosynthesis/predicted SAM-dependent methyltransferase